MAKDKKEKEVEISSDHLNEAQKTNLKRHEEAEK